MAFLWYPDSVANILRTFKGFGVRLYGATSGSVGVKPATAAGSADYTLPGAAPSVDGQSLTCTMAGVLSFAGPHAPLSSPALTGTPTAPTASNGTNSTQIATTAFVQSALPSVPVTSVAGKTGAVTLAEADIANLTSDLGAKSNLSGATFTGAVGNSTNGAASAPAMSLSGSIFTGGTGTTTQPLMLLQPSTAANATSWSTNGTLLGLNAPSGFAGNFIDVHLNGSTSSFSVSSSGALTAGSSIATASLVQCGSTQPFVWSGRSKLTSPSDGIVTLNNNAANGFTRLQMGGTTASFPAIKVNGSALNFRLADDSADCAFTASNATLSGTVSTADPTSGSGPAWKLGTVKAATVALNTTNYVEVNIGGTSYKLALAT